MSNQLRVYLFNNFKQAVKPLHLHQCVWVVQSNNSPFSSSYRSVNPVPVSSSAASQPNYHKVDEDAPFFTPPVRAQLISQFKQLFYPMPKVQRSRLSREFLSSVTQETSAAARYAVKHGQAWLDKGEPGSMREKLNQFLQMFMRRIDSKEDAFREVRAFLQAQREAEQRRRAALESKSSTSANTAAKAPITISVYIPSTFSTYDLFSPSMLESFRKGEKFHDRWLVLNVLFFPCSISLGLLPGPNVFFAWNAYRALAHYQAREGHKELQEIILKQEENSKGFAATAYSGASTSANASERIELDVQIQLIPYDDSLAPSALMQQFKLNEESVLKHMSRWKNKEDQQSNNHS